MKDRITLIRKNNGLTQKEFGEKIGVKGNTITNYENGLRTPSDAIIYSICREFHINEEWLRTGQGEMLNIPSDLLEIPHFNELPPDEQKELVELAISFLELDKSSRNAIMTIANNLRKKREKM